jgi:hypothetical protein
MKDLTDHAELRSQIPLTAREFRFDNLVLKITKKNDTYGMVIKNIETPRHHHTFIAENQKPSIHYTKESDGIVPNTQKHIDFQQFQQTLSDILQNIFSDAQKISPSDPKFATKPILMLVSQKMFIAKKTSKKVVFDQEIGCEESFFQDITTHENRIGVMFDENGSEESMIIIQNGEIYKIDLRQFNSGDKEMDLVFRP